MPTVRPVPFARPGRYKFRMLLTAAAVASALAGCGQDPMSAGAELMKKGDFPAAVIELKNAVQAKPSSPEARLALAEALERTYDEVGAEQHLRKAIANGADPNAILPRVALLMLERKESAKVINEFKDKKLESPEADSDLRAAVAVAYLNQNQPAAAQQQLGLAAKKTDATMLANAQLQLAQGKKEQALVAIEDAHGNKGTPWWVLRGLGRINEAAGNREKAFELMSRAYEAAPWHQSVMGEYGEFLASQGKWDEAIAIRDRLKKQAPGFYWTHYIDALVLSQQGKTEASQAAALKVLRASPDHLPANLLVASAELQKGDVMMANLRLQKIATQHAYSLPLLQLLTESQIRLGKYAEATDSLRRGLSVAPKDGRLLSLKADAELAQGRTKEATATLEQLTAAFPGNPAYLLRLSELKMRSGNQEAARQLLDQAAAAGKDNPAIRDRVLTSYLALGDIPAVQRLADYALQNKPQDPLSHLVMAAALGAQKNQEGSWQSIQKALDLQPAFQPALRAMGLMAGTPARQDELFARYGKAVAAKDAGEEAFLVYARLLRDRKKDSEVTATLEKGVTAVPTSVALRQALAQEHFRSGKPEAALSVIQSGASANNASPEASALLGETYERMGDLRLATETFRKLAASYPQRADWRLKLADLEAAGGGKKEATTILRSLITDRPLDPQPYIVLANLTVTDNLPEALSIARELGSREPHQLTAMLLEGDLLMRSNKMDDALKQYVKAGKAGAQPTAALRTTQLLDRTQRSSAADLELADIMRKFPQDPTVIGFAAQRLRAQGKPDKAIALLQQMADKTPRNPVVLNDLAWAQIEAKHPDALKNAAAAAALAPDNPVILDTLGQAQAAGGNRASAIATLRMASNLAPKAVTPKIHLAEQLIADGDKKSAAPLLRSIDAGSLAAQDKETYARLMKTIGG